jgi:hypothetical protein
LRKPAQPRRAWAGPISERALARVCTGALCFTLFGCARLQSCGADKLAVPPPPAAQVEGVEQAHGEQAAASKPGRRSKRPQIKNTGSAWRALMFFLPDKFEGYRARMAIEGRDVSLGPELGLISVRRAYGNKDDLMIEVELIDVSQSPRVRELFNRSRELQRESEKAVIRPLRVHGQKALSQWLDSTKTARTSVLVADRFLVSANVKPAASVAPSLDFVQKLDWAALEQFAAGPPLPPEAELHEPAVAAQVRPAALGEPASRPSAADAPDSSLLASQPP